MERVQGQPPGSPQGAPVSGNAAGHTGKSGEGAQSALEHLIAQELLRSAGRRPPARPEGEAPGPQAPAKP